MYYKKLKFKVDKKRLHSDYEVFRVSYRIAI